MAQTTQKAPTKQELLERTRALLPAIRERAQAGEDARAIPRESVDEFLDAGFARILAPKRVGGWEMGLDTWVDIAREIAAVDGSHGWCASLMIHHPHYLGMFPEGVQDAIWADGLDQVIAGSIQPVCQVTEADGGYTVSGRSPFASGVLHSDWVMVAGFLPEPGPPQWTFFFVPKSDYEVVDTWQTVAMRGTGSNTIVTDNVFVPESHILKLSDAVNGTQPGATVNDNPMYSVPFVAIAPLTFAGPMLGIVQGALANYLEQTTPKKTPMGTRVAESPVLQVRLGRLAADVDAAELLIRRAIDQANDPKSVTLETRARTMRDAARASEILISAMSELLALSGTSGFTESSPIQRAWRDANFAARHVALSPDMNYPIWSKRQFEVDLEPGTFMY